MSRARAALILHIGQHKTGSKALQSFLTQNRQMLLEEGILYPAEESPEHGIRAYAMSQFRLFALARRQALGACHGQTAGDDYWTTVSRFCQPFETTRSFFEALETKRNQQGPAHVVLSAEDLFDMQTAHELDFSLVLVKAAAEHLAGLAAEFAYDPRIVVYLRRQDHLLGAHYVQFIKGSAVHDLDFDEFSRAFAPRLDLNRILEQWASAFGRDRVLVRPYEQVALPHGIVADFFQHALERPIPTGCVEPPADAESVNRSLGRDFVEYIRILNRRSARALPIFPRDAVLEAALRETPSASGTHRAGIAEWLSPADRCQLIASFSEGNGTIARDFMKREDGRFFMEPLPQENETWSPYPGLSPETATAISLEIHELLLARQPPARHSVWARARTRLRKPIRKLLRLGRHSD